jgi:hypothetical protein
MCQQALGQPIEPVGVCRGAAAVDDLAIGTTDVKADALACKVKSGVQHVWASFGFDGQAEPVTEEALLHGIQLGRVGAPRHRVRDR